MKISFYLNNEQIMVFEDMQSNPFSKNDIIDLSVTNLTNRDFLGYPQNLKNKISS